MEQTSPLPNTPITLPTMTTPPINPPSSNKNVLIIFLVIFVIVLVSLNAYLFLKLQNQSKTPVASPAPVVQASPTLLPAEASVKEGDPTTNWKTYSDQQGYSFQYPSNWKIIITPQIGKFGNLVSLSFSEQGKDYQLIINQGGRGGPEADEITNSQVVIGGKSLNKRTWIKNGQPFLISIAPDKAGFNYFNHIEFMIPLSNIDKYLSLFDQVLSTFKFLE